MKAIRPSAIGHSGSSGAVQPTASAMILRVGSPTAPDDSTTASSATTPSAALTSPDIAPTRRQLNLRDCRSGVLLRRAGALVRTVLALAATG